MIKIHAIRTGSVKIKTSQQRKQPGSNLPGVLLDRSWTGWLPIYAWVIEHPEGLYVVDTGETARTLQRGYFPWWQLYFSMAVRFEITPEQEIGPQMRKLGLDPQTVRTVIMTHLHTDHAGGLHHFPNSRILVHPAEFDRAQGFSGKLQGYLPHRWPEWFEPEMIHFEQKAFGPFDRRMMVTQAEDILIVPTPGHTFHHVSVIVLSGGLAYFLAGDSSYLQSLLLEQHPDGVTADEEAALDSLERILKFTQEQPTVYLPCHDPDTGVRLIEKQVVDLKSR